MLVARRRVRPIGETSSAEISRADLIAAAS
jgi:hypothetical protein